MNIQKDVILKDYTSWRVGGQADFFCLPSSIDDIFSAQKWALQNQYPITILGNGSNVLISDRGIRGLTICLRALSGIETELTQERVVVRVLAGTLKSDVMRIFTKHRLAPALFLAGLPGDIGGGIVMNAGVGDAVAPREFGEIVDWFEVLKPSEQLQIEKFNRDEIQWQYRKSSGWQPGIVVRAQLSWMNQPQEDILEKIKQANRHRMQRQPLEWPSCGSVFKNPLPQKSGQLIESCGLKGFTLGGAQVSTKHANFIINLGTATARDLDQLIQHVQKTVHVKTGVQLHPEVVRLGEWP